RDRSIPHALGNQPLDLPSLCLSELSSCMPLTTVGVASVAVTHVISRGPQIQMVRIETSPVIAMMKDQTGIVQVEAAPEHHGQAGHLGLSAQVFDMSIAIPIDATRPFPASGIGIDSTMIQQVSLDTSL